MDPIRIFISSPGDVQLERQVARRVIGQLQAEFAGSPSIEPYFWEYEPMRLTQDYTAQIPRTSTFDIVVCILWSRLGTQLGSQHARPDGTVYKSGTEFEIEDAADAAKTRGVPDLLVYRNKTDPVIRPRPKEERERQIAQFDALEAFLDHWTREGETFKGALTTYSDAAQFEELLTEHLRKLIRTRRPAAGVPAERHLTWSAGSPYRGLRHFDYEHAPIFRGRTRAIEDVIALLRGQRVTRQAWTGDASAEPPPIFVMVSAMSGIGKSSLVRAGVLPLLTVPGVVEGIGLWRRAVVKPAGGVRGLFEALAEALTAPDALPELLSDGTSKEALAQLLRSNPAGSDGLIKGALSQSAARLHAEEEAQLSRWEAEFVAAGRTADAERCRKQRAELCQREAALALFVDQFEEIFASDKTVEPDREAFLAAINRLARSGRVFVMGSLRSDFLGRTTTLPVLAALMREGALYQLEPPTPSELAQIIRDPAREAGLTFEQDRATGARLDDVLLAATQGSPAALPLLEFTLDRLYEKRGPEGQLTFSAYHEMHEVEGAIAQTAEAEFSALSPEATAAFGTVFAALVNLSDTRGGERPVRRQASADDVRKHPGAAEFIDRFAAARLLVLDQDEGGKGSVSVVHEALFSHWNRLATWIEDNRDRLRVRGRVEQVAARWETEGRPRDLLLPDGRLLAEAQDLVQHAGTLAVSDSVRQFVQQSVAARRSRLYRRVAAIVVLTTGIGIAAVVSWYQYQSYLRNQLEAVVYQYKQAVRESEKRFLSHGPRRKQIQQAFDSTRKVLTLIDKLRAMQGHPPEGWVDATAKAHEFGAVLMAELGNAAGAKREIEARKAMAPTGKKKMGLAEVLGRNPEMMSYALTVFDLMMQLELANDDFVALIKQNPALKKALNERYAATKGKPDAPPKPKTLPQSKAEREREDFKRDQAFVTLSEYMTQEFGRETDFGYLQFFLQRVADAQEKSGKFAEAEKTYKERVAAAERRLNFARKAVYVELSADRKRMIHDAALSVVEHKRELSKFYMRRNNYKEALKILQDDLQTMDAQPELADADDQRFELRQLIVHSLLRLNENKRAFAEAKSAVNARLAASRSYLQSAWGKTTAAYDDGAAYWESHNVHARAVAVARQIVDALEHATHSPLATGAAAELPSAYLALSWHLLLDHKFKEAETNAEKGLVLKPGDIAQAWLNKDLAHALLLQGQTQRARAIYEAWKNKPMEVKKEAPKRLPELARQVLAKKPKLFAQAVLDDFKEFEREGLLKGIDGVGEIRAAMQAALAAAEKSKPQPMDAKEQARK